MVSWLPTKLISILLPIVGFIVLAVIFFGLLYPKLAGETRTGIAGIADKFIGKETIKAGEMAVSPIHLQAINKLKQTIEQLKSSPDNECYLSYQLGEGSNGGENGFPPLGEKGTKIQLEATSKGIKIVTFGGAEGLQEAGYPEVSGVTPCVISGGDVPKNFYEIYSQNKVELKSDSYKFYFNPVNKILIKQDSGGWDGFSENRISYDGFLEKDIFLDFEDGGIIFKIGRNICFFPTYDDRIDPIGSCDGDSSRGLDDSCLGVTKSLIYLSKESFKQCGEGSFPPRLRS